MASIVVAGDTSGTVTLAAPAVSGTTTLTLPTTSGTVIASNSSGNVGIGTTSPLSRLQVKAEGQNFGDGYILESIVTGKQIGRAHV